MLRIFSLSFLVLFLIVTFSNAYTISSLGTYTSPSSINDNGQVVGYSAISQVEISGFVYDSNTGVKTSSNLGGQATYPTSINNNYQIVGVTSASDGTTHGFLYEPSSGMQLIGPSWSQAKEINDHGQIAGYAYSEGSNFALLYDASTGIQNLGTLGGFNSYGLAINNSAQVVGAAQVAEGDNHAFLYDASTGMQDLGTLGGRYSSAADINNNGQVVGQSTTSQEDLFGFIYDANTGMQNLGSLWGMQSDAFAINDSGQVVGYSARPDIGVSAFLYDSESGMQDLNSLLNDSHWDLEFATDINNQGVIVGQGYLDGVSHGFIMTPDEVELPFQLSDAATNPGLSSRAKVFTLNDGEFDPDAPTYVISHGWQNGADYLDADWNFSEQDMPTQQLDTVAAIMARLNGEEGGPGNANFITFEWEGAYTGGWGLDGELLANASRQARNNAETAGYLLGNELDQILGENYNQDLHFIGHSYGTVVNALSTRFLELYGRLDSADDIQFTTLDSPTHALTGFAPNLNEDWFQNNLSDQVDFFDNYYGYFFLNPAANGLVAYGEELVGAGLNQPVQYSHGAVWDEFYLGLIEYGPNADTNPDIVDLWPYDHEFNDWITPMLSTYGSRPDQTFSSTSAGEWILSDDSDFQEFHSVLGTPVQIDELVGGVIFNGILLQEQSPVSGYYFLDIPLEAEWLTFDWMVDAGGDGDWLTVHFGSDLLWSMAIDSFLEGILLNAMIDISDFAGQQGELYFTLNNVGEANAGIYVGNFELRGTEPVPEPSTILLLGSGLAGLAFYRRKKK